MQGVFVFDKLGLFRLFADGAAIRGRDIDDSFQFRPGIPDLDPEDLLVTDRDYSAVTHRTVLLFFGQGIHLHTADRKIGKHLIIAPIHATDRMNDIAHYTLEFFNLIYCSRIKYISVWSIIKSISFRSSVFSQ